MISQRSASSAASGSPSVPDTAMLTGGGERGQSELTCKSVSDFSIHSRASKAQASSAAALCF
jgi:hypothetical protein